MVGKKRYTGVRIALDVLIREGVKRVNKTGQ